MNNKRILVIGGTGMLGHKLIQVLENDFVVGTIIRTGKKNVEKFGFYKNIEIYDEIDVLDFEAVERVIEKFKPDVTINAVGIIKQLPESKDEFVVLDINSIFPKRLADITEKYNFKLINVSTDCVFSGERGYYTEDILTDAGDLYGKSKFLGEVISENCLTIRTSIIGRELETCHSLVEWFLSNKGKKVKGYKKAIFSGFPTIILSEILADIIKNHSGLEGLYHVSSEPINKFDLLQLVKEHFGVDIEINPDNDFVIDRSLDSTRFINKTGFQTPSWAKMIEKMAADPTPYDQWRKQIF